MLVQVIKLNFVTMNKPISINQGYTYTNAASHYISESRLQLIPNFILAHLIKKEDKSLDEIHTRFPRIIY